MEDLSLHILDVVENSIKAGAKNIVINIREVQEKDLLEMEIRDNGKGMDETMMKKASDPFVTTKANKKTGFGLALLEEAARSTGGSFSIESQEGLGTTVRSTFRNSHWDRKPMGNIGETLFCLIVTNPEVHFSYQYIKGEETYKVDTQNLKEKAGESANNLPEWIKFLKENIESGFDNSNLSANLVKGDSP